MIINETFLIENWEIFKKYYFSLKVWFFKFRRVFEEFLKSFRKGNGEVMNMSENLNTQQPFFERGIKKSEVENYENLIFINFSKR